MWTLSMGWRVAVFSSVVRERRRVRKATEFLAPVGPGVRVALCEGGEQKFFRKVLPFGVRLNDFLAAVRVPNAGRSDREDLEPENQGRIRRWVKLKTKDGRMTVFRVAIVVIEEADERQHGSIEVITAFREDG